MVKINRQYIIFMVVLFLLLIPYVALAANIQLEFENHSHAKGADKIDIKQPGEHVSITITAPSGWKIHDCKFITGEGTSNPQNGFKPPNFNPKSSVTFDFVVGLVGLSGSVAAKYTGHLVHPGGHGGGKLPDFTALAKNAHYQINITKITPSQHVYVGCNTSPAMTFKAQLVDKNGIPVADSGIQVNWLMDNGDPNNPNSTTTNSKGCTSWTWTPKESDIGNRTVTAKLSNSNSDEDAVEVSRLDVASLTPDQGKKIETVNGPDSDGDGKPDYTTAIYAVYVVDDNNPNSPGPFINVTATSSPNVALENLPSCWNLTKNGTSLPITDSNSNGIDDNTGENKLLAKIDKTQIGKTLVIAKAGENQNRVLVKVVKPYVLQITAWIPYNHLENPLPGNGTLYKGDVPPSNFYRKRNSFRLRQTITVEPLKALSISGKLGYNGVQIGQSESFDPDTSLNTSGNLSTEALEDKYPGVPLKIDWATAIADTDKIKVVRVDSKTIKIHLIAGAANPLVSGSPQINWDLYITINVNKGMYMVSGNLDGFPAYDIYMNDKRIYKHDPRITGDGLLSLYPPMEYSLVFSSNLP